jgi:hypothetical protein
LRRRLRLRACSNSGEVLGSDASLAAGLLPSGTHFDARPAPEACGSAAQARNEQTIRWVCRRAADCIRPPSWHTSELKY